MPKLIIVFLSLSFFYNCTESGSRHELSMSHFIIKVDPRIELLSIVMNYSEWPYYGKFTDSTYLYYKRVKKHFDKYKNHPAVKWFDKQGVDWNLDDPVTIMLWASNPSNMKIIHPFPLHPTSQMDTNDVKRTIDLLNQFAEVSGFEKFWQENQEYYQEYEQELVDLLPFEKYTNKMIKFFNEDKARFIFIPAPMLDRVSFGPQLNVTEGKIPHFISGVSKIEFGKPWKNEELMRMLIFHEFGHSFVNPICEKYRDSLFAYEYLFEYLREDMSQLAYPDWLPTIHEHIVRAVQSHMMKLIGFEKEAEEDYKENLRLGFSLLPFFKEKIEYYSDNRNDYNAFEKFFPELIEVLQEVEPYKTKSPLGMKARFKIVDKNKIILSHLFQDSPLSNFALVEGDTIISCNNYALKNQNDIYKIYDNWYDSTPGGKIVFQIKRGDEIFNNDILVPFIERYKFISRDN